MVIGPGDRLFAGCAFPVWCRGGWLERYLLFHIGEVCDINRRHSMALGAPAVTPNGSAPRCTHLDELAPVTPRSDYCADCRAQGESWKALLVCLTCGWVACSDDSPRRHASAHYRETDHPVAAGLAAKLGWRWCYVHRRRV
jgi:hypothetical protein